MLPIKLVGAVLALLSFWLCCRLSFLVPASKRPAVVAKLGNWHWRTCLFWCGFWRVTWIKVGQQDGDGGSGGAAKSGRGGGGSSGDGGEGDAPAVGIVSNHISWCDILVHMSHSFPSFVARSQTRKTPVIGIIRCAGGAGAVAAVAGPSAAAPADAQLSTQLNPCPCMLPLALPPVAAS